MTAPAQQGLRRFEALADNIPGCYQGGRCFRHPDPQEALRMPTGECLQCFAERCGEDELRRMVRERKAGDRERLYRRVLGQLPASAGEVSDSLGLGYQHVTALLRALVRSGRVRLLPSLGETVYDLPRVEEETQPAPRVPRPPSLVDRIVALLGDGRPRSKREIAMALEAPELTAYQALSRALSVGRVAIAERVRDPRGGPLRVLWGLPARTESSPGTEGVA